MCGLVGVVGNLYAADVKIFNEMLYCNLLRGSHATGVASIKGKKASVLKRAWVPGDLMQLPAYDKLVNMQADVLIGHNRHGTIGNNALHTNAHPFDFENVVGAHNGTLTHACVKNLHDANYYGTDSEALYSEINENGIDTAFTKIGGAWALTFYDKTDNTINFVRNDQRTLFYAYKKGRSVMYWASEREMLDWIITRNKIELEDDEIYDVTPDTLYSWQVGRVLDAPIQVPLASSWKPPATTTTTHHRAHSTTWEQPKYQDPRYRWSPIKKDWVLKEEHEDAASGGTSQQGAPFPGAQQATATQAPATDVASPVTKTGSTTSMSSTATDKLAFIDQARERRELLKVFGPHSYRDKHNNFITKSRFDSIMEKSCCSYCGNDDIHYGDPVMFLQSTTGSGLPEFLCEHCLRNPEAHELVPELERKIGK